MQLTHFQQERSQNGHMELTGSCSATTTTTATMAVCGCRLVVARCSQVGEEKGGSSSKWCVCTKIVRFLTLNGRKQANLFHKFAQWLNSTWLRHRVSSGHSAVTASTLCSSHRLPLFSFWFHLLPLPPPYTCYTVDCSAKQLTKTADREACKEWGEESGGQVWLNLG